ncbi:chemotaxis protein MotB [Candidatus Magnetoovum chiemensis]|nr:chemotaxis protein MotB [Candidatus Magnetoovum chiemensis]
MKEHVYIEHFAKGVKIQVVDKKGEPLFPLGSEQPTVTADKIMKVIAGYIKDLKNTEIAIEGHTDALKYSTQKYTNWELSTARASSARRSLERYGLNPDMLVRVSGFAATEPYVKDNPADPKNRRISIVLYPQGENESALLKTIPGFEEQTGAEKASAAEEKPAAQTTNAVSEKAAATQEKTNGSQREAVKEEKSPSEEVIKPSAADSADKTQESLPQPPTPAQAPKPIPQKPIPDFKIIN